MRHKRKIFILLFSVIIYFTLSFLYNSFLANSNLQDIYVLKEDVKRGEKIAEKSLEKVKIDKSTLTNEIFDISSVDKYVFNNSYTKGQILLNSLVLNIDDYKEAKEQKEIFSFKVNNPDDIVSYQISKGSIINIYYTGKKKQANEIVTNSDLESINSSMDDGFVTIKLLDKVKVIQIYDKFGNDIETNFKLKNDTCIIDTVLIELDKETVMKVNNLKNYGNFSVSLIK